MRLIYLIHNKNSTRWFPHTFNPLITESMAPVITEFHVTTVYEGYVAPLVPNAKAHVVAEVRDVAGISKVRIRSLCPDVIYILMIWEQEFQFSGEETTVYIDTVIDVTEYSAVLTYNISVNATDTLGNSAEWYKEVDGPVGAFIKTVANMLRAFWDFLCEVGAKILEAVNVLWHWILEIINLTVQTLLAPIWNMWRDWVNDINALVSELIPSRQGDAIVNEGVWLRGFTDLLFNSPFAILVQGLSWGIIALEWTLFAFACVVPISLIGEVIAGLIVSGAKAYTALLVGGSLISFSVGVLIGYIIPPTNPIWNFWLNVGELLATFIGTLTIVVVGHAPLGLGDAAGLSMSLMSFFWGISLAGLLHATAEIASIISLVIAIIGTVIAFVYPNEVPGLIGWIDEFIDLACVGVNAAITAKLILR